MKILWNVIFIQGKYKIDWEQDDSEMTSCTGCAEQCKSIDRDINILASPFSEQF